MDDLWSVSNDIAVPKSRYICGIDGCTKSYASRQNRYRHRSKDHPTRIATCPTPKRARNPAVKSLDSERTMLLQAFSTLSGPCSDEVTTSFDTSHKPVNDNLGAFSTLIDHEPMHLHSAVLNDPFSCTCMEDRFIPLQGQATTTQVDDDQSVVVRACLDIAQRGTPESVAFLRRMGHMMISIAKYADEVNPRSSNHMELLRDVLDSLYINNTVRQNGFAASLLRERSVSSGFSPVPTDVSSTISQSDDLTSSSEQPPHSPAVRVAIPTSIYSGSVHGSSKRMRSDPVAVQLATASLDLGRHNYENVTVDSHLFDWES